MEVLYLNLTVVYIFSLFARYFSKMKKGKIKINKGLVFLVIISLVLVSGLRRNIGDTYFYMYSYEFRKLTWDDIKFQGDFGFNILQMYLQKISENPQLLILATALITNILVIFVLYKYSRYFELSLYVYITGGLFLVSMNGIRQMLAAAIIFTATKYLINGNWKMYMLIILIASTFHQSALTLIPIYFLVRYKAWSKATIILVITSIIIVLGFDQFTKILFSAIEDTQYSHYQDFAEGGANIIRVVVNAVPILIAYLGRDKLRRIFPESDYIVNMSIVGFIFMIIATQNWIFARFSIYFDLYLLILISWIVKLFKDSNQLFVYYGILICYFLYYYYENVISLNIQYRSDIITLFN